MTPARRADVLLSSASGAAVSTKSRALVRINRCEAAPRVLQHVTPPEGKKAMADHQAVRAAHQLRQVLRREERKRLRKVDQIRQDLVELQTPKALGSEQDALRRVVAPRMDGAIEPASI